MAGHLNHDNGDAFARAALTDGPQEARWRPSGPSGHHTSQPNPKRQPAGPSFVAVLTRSAHGRMLAATSTQTCRAAAARPFLKLS